MIHNTAAPISWLHNTKDFTAPWYKEHTVSTPWPHHTHIATPSCTCKDPITPISWPHQAHIMTPSHDQTHVMTLTHWKRYIRPLPTQKKNTSLPHHHHPKKETKQTSKPFISMSFYQTFSTTNVSTLKWTTRFPCRTFLVKDKHISVHYVSFCFTTCKIPSDVSWE